jgi:hypothetical protein
MASHSSEITSGGCEPWLRTRESASVSSFSRNYEPEVGQEEVDIVYIVNLLNKRWQTLSEQFRVPVYDDIKIDSMLPACQECLAIVTPYRYLSPRLFSSWKWGNTHSSMSA